MRTSVFALPFAGALVFLACASAPDIEDDGGGGDGGGLTTQSAELGCDDLASSLCAKLGECGSPLLAATFGDAATCLARVELECTSKMAAPGSGYKDATVCASAIAGATCDDYWAVQSGAACAPVPGTLADGSSCTDDSQCTSTYCKRLGEAACGTCAPRTTVGSSCVSDADACAVGSVCATTCAVPAPKGGACNSTQPCVTGLVCDSGFCVGPLQLGAQCFSVGVPCDAGKGLYCDTVAGQCKAIQIVGTGQSCGLAQGMGCSGGVCMNGTCEPHTKDGALCDSSTPSCTYPASCIDSRCKIAASATCSAGGGACGEACSRSQGSVGGTKWGGTINWNQGNACEALSPAGSTPAGASCGAASECVGYECPCCAGARGYTASACIGGVCSGQAQTCSLALEASNDGSFDHPLQCE